MSEDIARLSTDPYLVTLSRVRKSIEGLEEDTRWFDGTGDSIRQRVAAASEVVRHSRGLISDPRTDYIDAALLDAASKRLEREASTLSEILGEFISVEAQESLQSLPSYRVASENRPPVLGEADPKLRRKAADKFLDEDQDWADFIESEPVRFVRRNSRLKSSEFEMRESAVNYAEFKTRQINSRLVRSQLIEDFVDQVELVRRHS